MAWTQALGDQRLPGNGSPLAERLVEAATDALNGTLIGAQVFGFSVAVRELFRGRPLSSLAPGHWWFLISAPQTIAGSLQYLIAIWTMGWFPDTTGTQTIDRFTSAILYFVIALLWFWAAWRMPTAAWRAVFGLRGAEQGAWAAFRLHRGLRGVGVALPQVAAMHFFGLMGVCFLGLVVAVLLAVLTDVRRGTKRDWLHWTGIGVMVAESVNFCRAFGQPFLQWCSALWAYLLA
jgi:hypothetical protein